MSETRHYGPGSDEGAESWAIAASLITTALCRARHNNSERF